MKEESIIKPVEHISTGEVSSTVLSSGSITLESGTLGEMPYSKKDWFLSGIAWKEINHSNFWHNSQIIHGGDYAFPDISFEYPSNWKFECCGDTDSLSAHFIYPNNESMWSSDTQDIFNPPSTFPSITLFSIMGDKIMMGGSIEHPSFMTRDEYMDSMGIDNDVPTNIPGWRIKKVIGTYPDFVDYLVKTKDGIVTFRFNNSKLFETGFETKFIHMLKESQ